MSEELELISHGLDKVINKPIVETINYPFPSINIKTKGVIYEHVCDS